MFVDILVLKFLFVISGIESNYGADLNHRTIASESSIHFGEAAIGLYALMPNTIRMLKKDPNRLKIDSGYEKQVAQSYALKILKVAKGCPLRASILWLKGPNSRPVAADYSSIRYKKFISEWEALTRIPIEKDPLILRYCQ